MEQQFAGVRADKDAVFFFINPIIRHSGAEVMCCVKC